MNGEADPAALAEKVRLLEIEKELMLGRLNALFTVVMQMALDRENPTQHLAQNLVEAKERGIADFLAIGATDLATNEYSRVTDQAVLFLQASASGNQKPS